jgi:hypothetical protein
METELERLSKLKEEAKANRQKSKPCKECKKKKEVVTKLPNLLHEEVFMPTAEEIGLAYAELTSTGGVKEDKKEFINKIFNALFGKDFDFKCRGCGNSEVRRFTNYVNANNIKY